MQKLSFPTPQQIDQKFQISKLENRYYLIDGQLKKWEGDLIDVVSPIRVTNTNQLEQVIVASYPDMSIDVAMEAVQSAEQAYDRGRGKWPRMTLAERIEHIEKFTFAMQEHREEIIKLLMWSIAKDYKSSEKEFDRTIAYINDTIDEAKNLDREASKFLLEEDVIAQVRMAPIGVVLCMGPYNYPINEAFALLIPALLMGNTVIFRSPHQGVPAILPLLEAFANSFPKGVINIIFGSSKKIIMPIVESGKVDIFSFIGSSQISGLLKKDHPYIQRLRAITGMDANNAGIIFDDANLDLTVDECLAGSLSYNGQRCTALKVLFVHHKIVDQFIEKFVEKIEKLKIAMPWESGVNITPMPDLDKINYLQELIADATSQGAKILNQDGGKNLETLMIPAVLYPVKPNMRVMKEEQFGPIVPIIPFSDPEEPLNFIANTDYGQQVSLFSSNPKKLGKTIDPLANQVCRININSQCQRGPDSLPFTGRRNSAEGILSVTEALRSFSIPVVVAGKKGQLNQQLLKNMISNHYSKFVSTDFIF